MNMVRPHELVRADTTVRYWIQGVEDSPTLVFLHGATLDHRSWHRSGPCGAATGS
jgi:pimeloyl-ACP methyl ester carboxylesterase